MRPDVARAEALTRLLTTPLGRVERDPGGASDPAAIRARELVAGVRRHLLTIDAILDRYLPKGVARVEPRLLEALRIGVFQLLYERHVAKPLVVASTVALAGPSSKKRGFLNAVLRRIASDIHEEQGVPPRRQRDTVLTGHRGFVRFPAAVLPDPDATLVRYLSAQFTQEPWFIEAMIADVGEEIDDLLLALSLPLPLAVRVNTLRATAEEAEAALVAAGAKISRKVGRVIETHLAGAIANCQPFRDGLLTVQDFVAAEVAPFLDPKPGERILDLCAGSGGKSTHIAEVSGGAAHVVAADVNPVQLEKLQQNLTRLGTPGVHPLFLAEKALESEAPFDRVLIDAPCSNSGVLMKRVAARYRLNPDAVSALVRKQLELLERGASAVRKGGVLVYSTCSILRDENTGVVERFLAQQGEAFVLEQTQLHHPHKTGRDGGFMARFVRQA